MEATDRITRDFNKLKSNGLKAKNQDQSSAMLNGFSESIKTCRWKGFKEGDIKTLFNTALMENIEKGFNKQAYTQSVGTIVRRGLKLVQKGAKRGGKATKDVLKATKKPPEMKGELLKMLRTKVPKKGTKRRVELSAASLRAGMGL